MDIGILSTIQKCMKKSILKIINKNRIGTGFFLSIPFQNKHLLRVIITCDFMLNKEDISQEKTIHFFLDEKYYKILIDKSRIVYTNELYNITIIEIKHSDSFDMPSFLEIDDRIFNDNLLWLIGLPINLLGYYKGKKCEIFSTEIKSLDLENYEIFYSCDGSYGIAGGPILNLDCKVIGIHIGSNRQGDQIGKLLNKPIEALNEYDSSFNLSNSILNMTYLEKDLTKIIESNSPERGN